ncbi:hypothetical protein DYI42_12060 [Vannielia litorea]|nr:hypothetical protein [Vannielia litorea]
MLLAALALAGCREGDGPAAELAAAAESFRDNRDAASLEAVSARIGPGTKRSEVEELIGPPTYSPVDGVAMYASNDRQQVGERDLTLGLIIDYRDADAKLTDSVQTISYGPIGE